MEMIILTKTPEPILSTGMYAMFEEAWKVAIEAQDHEWAVAAALGGMPSMSQSPGGCSLSINLS